MHFRHESQTLKNKETHSVRSGRSTRSRSVAVAGAGPPVARKLDAHAPFPVTPVSRISVTDPRRRAQGNWKSALFKEHTNVRSGVPGHDSNATGDAEADRVHDAAQSARAAVLRRSDPFTKWQQTHPALAFSPPAAGRGAPHSTVVRSLAERHDGDDSVFRFAP